MLETGNNLRAAIASRNLRGKTGVSAIVFEHIAQLHKRGFEVDVIGHKLDKHMIENAGGNAVRVRRPPGSRYLARRYFSHRFSRLAKKNRYDLTIGNSEILEQDILFVHNLSRLERDTLPGNPSAGLLAKVRFDDDLYSTMRYKLCIANSELTRTQLIRGHNQNPNDIRVAYPGFDPSTFNIHKRNETRARVREDLCLEDEFLIGFITSGHFAKRGSDILLETIAALDPETRKKVKVLTVGTEANLDLLKSQFEQKKLAERLILKRKTDDIAAYYQAIDLLFHPARMEEYGLVIIEAAACGTPVLASAKVGAMEIFNLPDTGLAPESDPELFLPQLAALINNPEILSAMASQQWTAAQEYSWGSYYNKIFSWYAELGLVPPKTE